MAVALTSEPVDDLNLCNQHLIYVMNDAVGDARTVTSCRCTSK